MLNAREIQVGSLGELRAEVLKQAKIQLNMNLSLLEMLKGNTHLEAMADLRKQCVKPPEKLIRELAKANPALGSRGPGI